MSELMIPIPGVWGPQAPQAIDQNGSHSGEEIPLHPAK